MMRSKEDFVKRKLCSVSEFDWSYCA